MQAECHPCYARLIEMQFSEALVKAAILKLKTEDFSALVDWISEHIQEEDKWAQWIADNPDGGQSITEGQTIDHLVSAQFTAELMKKGHSKNVSQKSLLLTGNVSILSAEKWIAEHSYDVDFQEELRLTGQAFQTSTLTPEEAKQKLKELTEKAREKRRIRQEEDERERELNRLKFGKQTTEMKRLAEEQAMKRKIELDKIQKQRDEDYKKRLLEQMRRERNQKLGIKETEQTKVIQQAKLAPKLQKMQQLALQCEQVKIGMHAYPQKAKLYFETVLIYVNNILKNNGEEKYRKINKENKAFQGRIVEVFGGVEILEVIGYEDEGGFYVLKGFNATELQACANILQRFASYYN